MPLYIACVLLVLIILNLDFLYSIPFPTLHREEESLNESPGSTFPQKIWQIWRDDPFNFEGEVAMTARTWLQKNPHMRYEVITDASEMTYVEQKYGPQGFKRPDIVEFYRSINLHIVKADLLRYLILYAEGGIYADIDVEALKPFSRFIPERHHEKDYDLIVGVEVDEPQFRDHPILGQKSQSFCQWTIISKPRHPAMMRLIENIMKWLTGVAEEQGVSLGEVELNFDQVITGTGPSAFTNALLAEMDKGVKDRRVTWDMFHTMDESKIVNRVLVLPVEAFCAGQGHSDSGNHGARGALVKHHYHASNWPTQHRRFNHPAYGQVEECNWDAFCVQMWDQNVAEYETLSEEEKQAKVEERIKLLQQQILI